MIYQGIELEHNEACVFLMLHRDRGETVSREDIFEQALGMDWDAVSRYVDVLVGRINKKFGRKIIRSVWGRGYLLVKNFNIKNEEKDCG